MVIVKTAAAAALIPRVTVIWTQNADLDVKDGLWAAGGDLIPIWN